MPRLMTEKSNCVRDKPGETGTDLTRPGLAGEIDYPMTELPPPPFTPESLAQRWDVSADQVRKLCRVGTLKHFRLGKSIFRIPAASVSDYEGACCDNVAVIQSARRPAPKIVMLPGMR
jgi:hypothetical protein